MRTGFGVLALVGVAVAGCSDERSVDFDIDDDGEFSGAQVSYAPGDQFAMLSEDGIVKLGLTSDHVYVALSDALREHVDREIAEGVAESDSRIGRMIGSAVRRGVRHAMDIDIDFRVDEVRDVDYRDGELVFDWVDPDDERTLRGIGVDDEPVTRAFREKDARAFVDAFRRVKRGETLRPYASSAARDTTVSDARTLDSVAADTSGGASF